MQNFQRTKMQSTKSSDKNVRDMVFKGYVVVYAVE